MTLAEDMVSDATDVFLDTDDFAQTWVMYPKGKPAETGTSVTVVPHSDGLDGTREVPGDGRVLNMDRSRSIRSSTVLSMAATITVTEQPPGSADAWEDEDGTIWWTKRVLGRDEAMQTVLVVRRDGDRTFRGQRRG